MPGIAKTELEGDAAEDQAEQHGGERRVERRQDDGIGQRKGRHQPAAAQHQPRLVPVPDRRDGVHRRIPLGPDAEGGEEDADAEVEAVHHDIHADGKGDDAGPDDREIHVHAHHSPSLTAWAGVMPAVRTGSSEGGRSPGLGGSAISFSR